MDKTLFEGCINRFNRIIDRCHLVLDKVITRDDILKMPLGDVQTLKQFCTEEQSKQDKIFSEVRHLLGMGNLSPVQTSQLIKCFKEYSAFRSDIKTIAMHLESITDLPGLPSKAKFKLEILGDFELVSQLRGGKEEESTTVTMDVPDEVTDIKGVTEEIKINNLSLLTNYNNGIAIKYRNIDVPEVAELLIAAKVSAKSKDRLYNMLVCQSKEIKTAHLYTIVHKIGDEYYLYFPYKVNSKAQTAKQHLFNYLSSKGVKGLK